MIAALSVRRQLQKRAESERAQHSGTSDYESEKVGRARRKYKRRECHHDPWAKEFAQILMGAYYWLVEPTSIKSELGNGLENTAWSKMFRNDQSILLMMMVFRLFNCMLVQTYYVPDEYWQSLEVAHHQAFGTGYLTWEWTAKIRGYLYPAVFTVLYKAVELLRIDSYAALVTLPRVLQGLLYAVSDLYLYKLSSKLSSPLVGQWTLLCSCLSWFTFYCATRTLTNTAETSLVVIGLYYYPWTKSAKLSFENWKFLWIAAISVIIRPTAAIIWIPLCVGHVFSARRRMWNNFILYTFTTFLFGMISLRIDKAFYGEWTLVPLNFFTFNISKKISHIYGTHPWHWYFTQGLPFVLSTHSILLLLGWKKCKNRSLQLLLVYSVLIYSALAHKEFRFVLPVLPLCMHVCGYYITVLHQDRVTSDSQGKEVSQSISDEDVRHHIRKLKEDEKVGADRKDADSGLTASDTADSFSETEIIEGVRSRLSSKQRQSRHLFPYLTPQRALILLLLGNIPMMLYFSLLHQRGAVDVMKFLNTESRTNRNMSVLFLMPCHSTPYYSHIHSGVAMRFLTCEPNLNNTEGYTDEAEAFYNEPIKWLKNEVVRAPSRRVYSHVVMFDSLEQVVDRFLNKGKYRSCSKHFYSHFPGDKRKSKHIKVFCR